jgi:predicted ribosomally synthesized peptide with nif11-like leader
MSAYALSQFIGKVVSDQTLQKELIQAIEGRSSIERVAMFVSMGARYGYAFTEDDVLEIMKHPPDQEMELSDEDLNIATGGGGEELGVNWVLSLMSTAGAK